VKLAASLFCVAALSLVGCAEEITPTGGMGEGIAPYKLGPESFDAVKDFDPSDVTKYEQKLSGAPIDSVCEGCVMDVYRVIDNSAFIDEVRVVSDGGAALCKIFVDHGQVVEDECGWFGP